MKLIEQFANGAFAILKRTGVSNENAYHLIRLQLTVFLGILFLPLIIYAMFSIDFEDSAMIIGLIIMALVSDSLSGIFIKKDDFLNRKVLNICRKDIVFCNIVYVFMILMSGFTAYLATLY